MRVWLIRGAVAAIVVFVVGSLTMLQLVYMPNFRSTVWDMVFAVITNDKPGLNADDWSFAAASTIVWVLPEVVVSLALYVIGERIAAKVFALDRPQAGRCASCGYNLRGVTGRCPECGRAAEQASSDDEPLIVLRD